jgi:hypothetical protein
MVEVRSIHAVDPLSSYLLLGDNAPMRPPRRFLPRACVTLLALALVLAPARRAQAGDMFEDIATAILATLVVGGVVVGTDVAFTVHDAAVTASGEHSSKGWSVAETIVMTPQALAFNAGVVAMAASGDMKKEAASAFLVIPAAWTGAMATHGMWSLASDKVNPGMLYGVSWAVGANLAFSSGAIASAFKKELPGLTFGVIEVVGTVPSLAVSASQLANPTVEPKAGWALLSVWSGALLVHGTASIVAGFKQRLKEEKEEEKQKDNQWTSRVYFAPTLLSDGVARVPGIVAGGAF